MHNKNDVHILIVDDIVENIQVAMNYLKEDSYTMSFADNGEDAIKLAKQNHYDLILLDIMMPDIDGFEVCKTIKTDSMSASTPIIFLTAKSDIDSISKGFEIGCVDYIMKPFHAEELLARVKSHVTLYRSERLLKQKNIELAIKNQLQSQRLLEEMDSEQREMIYILMEVMESTSDETGLHIKRVAEISKRLAELVPSLSEEDARVLFYSSPMHDIGKIAIPREILHKPGKLTEDEYTIMKTHAAKGAGFLKKSKRKLLKAAAIIAEQHHEKWDGSGYPNKLQGEQIHIYGRIVALADVFDALTHKRVYKQEWTMQDAVDYILEQSGKHFDPQLVSLFINHLDDFKQIIQRN